MISEQQPLIEPISRDLLESELSRERFLRNTNKGNNQLFVVNDANAPNVLREIGRLRELTFRASGGGTGHALDLDEFDSGPFAYDQLIVYSPEDGEIIGGYRFKDCASALENGRLHLSTANYFSFSPTFLETYLPYTIELGRSWVQPMFQPSVNPRKGVFALDNIWDGLGAIVVDNPRIRYFFGKVTMYTRFQPEARDLILYFLHTYFPDTQSLLKPHHPLPINTDVALMKPLFEGLSFSEAFKVLNKRVRELGENIPPLVNIYMNLSPTMKTFGTALNPHFGDVEETGIMVTIADIYPEKKERHIASYKGKSETT